MAILDFFKRILVNLPKVPTTNYFNSLFHLSLFIRTFVIENLAICF